MQSSQPLSLSSSQSKVRNTGVVYDIDSDDDDFSGTGTHPVHSLFHNHNFCYPVGTLKTNTTDETDKAVNTNGQKTNIFRKKSVIKKDDSSVGKFEGQGSFWGDFSDHDDEQNGDKFF